MTKAVFSIGARGSAEVLRRFFVDPCLVPVGPVLWAGLWYVMRISWMHIYIYVYI